jgi:hypothetical protein
LTSLFSDRKRFENRLQIFFTGLKTFENGLQIFFTGLKTFENGLQIFFNGWKRFENGLQIFFSGWKTFENGLQIFFSGWKTFENGLQIFFNGWKTFENELQIFFSGWKTFVNDFKTFSDRSKTFKNNKAIFMDDLKTCKSKLFTRRNAGEDFSLSSTRIKNKSLKSKTWLRTIHIRPKGFSFPFCVWAINRFILSITAHSEQTGSLSYQLQELNYQTEDHGILNFKFSINLKVKFSTWNSVCIPDKPLRLHHIK